MKTLENKQTSVPVDVLEGSAKYSDLIKIVCDRTPERGWTATIMRERFRIQEKVEQADGTIELEDADATAVAVLVKNMTWSIKHKDLVMFEEDILKSF